MLTTIPIGWSCTFSVMDGTECVAQVTDLSCWSAYWSEKARLRLQGATYTARRDKGRYVLESQTGAIARAEQPGRRHRTLVVSHSGHEYTLRAKSAFLRELLLLDGSTQIGSLSRDWMFIPGVAADLPPTWPLVMRVFVIWLATALWRHEASDSWANVGRPGWSWMR